MRFKQIVKREKNNFINKCKFHHADYYTFCDKCNAPIKASFSDWNYIHIIEMRYVETYYSPDRCFVCPECLQKYSAFDRKNYHMIHEGQYIILYLHDDMQKTYHYLFYSRPQDIPPSIEKNAVLKSDIRSFKNFLLGV